MISYITERLGEQTAPHDTQKHRCVREQIARQVDEFLARGKTITQVQSGITGLGTSVVKDEKTGRVRWETNKYSRLFLEKSDKSVPVKRGGK